MRLGKSISQLSQTFNALVIVLGALTCLLASPLAAQKVVVLTTADIGKTVTGTHHYAQTDPSFVLSLKHRMGDQKTWQVSLQKTQQFEKSPFTLKTTLPATVGPDGTLDIEFGVTYSKSLQMENTISLLAVPMGEADALNKGIAINIKLSADGVLMFFNDKIKQYQKTLPTFEFVGVGERLLEVTWNGGGAKGCRVKIEDSGRNAFSLVPNTANAAAVTNGSSVQLSNGGTSFFIRYDGAAPKGAADLARITFTESGGQSIVVTMIGTNTGGNSLIAAARELIAKGNLMGGYTPPVVAVAKTPVKEPVVVKTPLKEPTKDPSKTPVVADAGNGKPVGDVTVPPKAAVETAMVEVPVVASPRTPSAKPTALLMDDFGDGLISEDVAKERLRKYHRRFGEDNLVKIASAKFEKNEGFYQARLRIVKADSLKNDANFILHFIRVKLKGATDSLFISAGDNAKMLGDTTLLLSLTSEDKAKLSSADSFQVSAEFFPEYESADGTVSNDSLVFKGVTFGKIYSNNNWQILLWASLIALVLLFFGIGFYLARQAVSSFRYLREARYQRERHNANSQRQRVEVETIHIDLARRDSDLIQLAFVDKGEGLDGRPEGGIEKVRSIAANVPAPRRNGLRRMFSWLYAPFGRKREPKFKSVYYSLRIELPRGSVPQHLRLKDETGMLLLGTNLTGNVLATDHQDFKFIKRPFSYSVYLDPAEFMDYTGAMKTVSIPFRVIEEPFEGYVMTREFNLNLEIAQRF